MSSEYYVPVDTETIGFHGPIVLIQYRPEPDAPIVLHDVFGTPIRETMKIIEWLHSQILLGFNNPFEAFHFNQLYNIFRFCDQDWYPQLHIDDMIKVERIAAEKAICLKPKSALDLMAHARKGPYQSTMDRDDIIIKRVPRQLAPDLCRILDDKVPLKDIYFARSSDPKRRWYMKECRDYHPDLVDVMLCFNPVSKLKALVADALGLTTAAYEESTQLPSPEEDGFAPFAKVGQAHWGYYAEQYISHWRYDQKGRTYAANDVLYNEMMLHYFSAKELMLPEHVCRQMGLDRNAPKLLAHGDDDSILAHMIGAVRWAGFELDLHKIDKLKGIAESLITQSPANFNSPEVVKKYLQQVMSEYEVEAVKDDTGHFGTGKIILEEIAKQCESEVCDCMGSGCGRCTDGLVASLVKTECASCKGVGCKLCNTQGWLMLPVPTEGAKRAKEVIEYRRASKEVELYDKLLLAGRFHVSLKTIGALSGRMSGADGLNPQGINRKKEVRSCFPLADGDEYRLEGGDFDGFEMVIMDAVYNDTEMRKDLQTKRPCMKCMKKMGVSADKMAEYRKLLWVPGSDKPESDHAINLLCDECGGTGWEDGKIHALFGQFLFAPLSYDEILLTKGLPGEQDKYSRSKNGVFAMAYGGEGHTLVTRVGVNAEIADAAYKGWCDRYPIWGAARRKIFDDFCSMRQPGGFGTRVVWNDPAEWVETKLGFRRYFTLENAIAKALFETAEDPPKEWSKLKLRITRRDKEQTLGGAARSALYGAAFAIQAGNMRAAANHTIQGTGAGLTKRLQVRIWGLQPVGAHKFMVKPFQVHDEIMCATHKSIPDDTITKIVDQFLVDMRSLVPLISLKWANNLKTWADK